MAPLSSTAFSLLVPVVTVLAFSASCRLVPENPQTSSPPSPLSFLMNSKLDDFFDGFFIFENAEISFVKVVIDNDFVVGLNVADADGGTVNHNVVQPWFVVTVSAEEKALILSTTNADYVLLKKNVGTAANAGQDASVVVTKRTAKRVNFSKEEIRELFDLLITNGGVYKHYLREFYVQLFLDRKSSINFTTVSGNALTYVDVVTAHF
eukprot:GHVS01107024.1.p1 GENE.GHVS01107024.1~~GHVS01107024.1.p1  ORF type:complete len:208 (+),score=37.35 GHVS01107024.1:1500-2123(+)